MFRCRQSWSAARVSGYHNGMTIPSFEQLDQVLRNAQAPVSAAEAHGCLCGALCTVAQFPLQQWLTELLPDEATEELAANAHLQQCHTQTLDDLASDDLDFEPLLPDDEVAMPERVTALAQWAQGFMYGFGLGLPAAAQNKLPGDIPEVLADLSEIARAESDGGIGEAEEQAYAELVEYLRAAVQLLYAELTPQRELQAQAAQHQH